MNSMVGVYATGGSEGPQGLTDVHRRPSAAKLSCHCRDVHGQAEASTPVGTERLEEVWVPVCILDVR